MNDELSNQAIDQKRRHLLQGAALAAAAGFAPGAFSKTLSSSSDPVLSGELICSISNPVKTLVLRNHSDKALVVNKIEHGAFMYDGGIVDCNAACLSDTITIQPNAEKKIQFRKQQQSSLTRKVEEFNRIQSRVTRLADGTRVIPFSATLNANVATIV